VKQAIHTDNISDWLNNKIWFIKGNKYEYKIEDNWYLVYFNYDPSDWIRIPCRFSKDKFNLHFTPISELRKQKLQKCISKD
jgi:hypothetical protein